MSHPVINTKKNQVVRSLRSTTRGRSSEISTTERELQSPEVSRRSLSETALTVTPEQIPATSSISIYRTPPVCQMGYSVYSSTADLHSCMSWYSVRELSHTLKAMRKLNFSLVEHRAQALQSLNSLNDDATYSKTQRFPENGFYICEAHGDWIRKFQQIRTSLATKDHVKDKKATTTLPDPTEHNDALLAYYNAISGLFTQLSQKEFLFNKERFETFYG